MAADVPASEIADTVTKTTYDETKALADERAAKLAAAEAKLQAYESRERAQLQSFQPDMEGLVKELATEFATPETKGHWDSFGEWTRNCHERPNLDSQMQLGTVIHACASKLKRTREDASVGSATADQLASALKENEYMKESNLAKDARIGELSNSLKEIQENSEKLQLQLEKAGALQEKFDFSKTTSREADAPAKEEDGIKKSTENASKMSSLPQFSAYEALSTWIADAAPQGNLRFMPAAGNHALLSSSQSGGNIMSSLRPM
jgi:hypothetical protein